MDKAWRTTALANFSIFMEAQETHIINGVSFLIFNYSNLHVDMWQKGKEIDMQIENQSNSGMAKVLRGLWFEL